MNKMQLVEKIAVDTGLTKTKVDDLLYALTSTISEELANGNTVNIREFGIFTLRKREKRVGKNPRTNEEVIISDKNIPKFKPSRLLKDSINS